MIYAKSVLCLFWIFCSIDNAFSLDVCSSCGIWKKLENLDTSGKHILRKIFNCFNIYHQFIGFFREKRSIFGNDFITGDVTDVKSKVLTEIKNGIPHIHLEIRGILKPQKSNSSKYKNETVSYEDLDYANGMQSKYQI